ncbi:hypothetical protein OHB56_03455 [Streptomyces sp. NBC_01635]|uniref:hypothetical protein n=1 Tax=Streptomyces sp. NBC_01635 TaxID=2975904 RepID=UPI00386B553B|nr:hypothetical protein OHB56_03455 [Streptomyces sp. NBC_01635]
MLTPTANGDTRLLLWLRVRKFAVPPSMIETATARRRVGDWAGACAAAGIDVDLDLRSLARTHGRALAGEVRSDLRHLAPDLLRWQLPRIAPDGLLRPGLTVALARYGRGTGGGGDGLRADTATGTGPVYLVVRTPPAWADGGQRFGLELWDGRRLRTDARHHPHPRPSPRFRLDLHRHLWDARRSGELRSRSGADRPADANGRALPPDAPELLPPGHRCAVDRWRDEAALVLRDAGHTTGTVVARIGDGRRLLLHLAGGGDDAPGPPALRISSAPADGSASTLPLLPYAATHVLPDLELLRTGALDPGQLHPLVASALAPGSVPEPMPGPAPTGSRRAPDPADEPRLVECRGERHRIGPVDGVLAALDHDPAEIGREELLAALTGTPLPCLQAIDRAHRRPDCLTGVRERLDHGDITGALAVVEGLLGPGARLRDGPLRDELEAAAERRIAYGLYRAGLAEPAPGRLPPGSRRPQDHRPRPHLAM